MKNIKKIIKNYIPGAVINWYHLIGAIFANVYYGFPSRKLIVIGVTGTDGKTTTCNLIYSILKAAGKEAGLISTINAIIGDKEYETGFHVTSPDPFSLQRFLRLMVDKGCQYAVLEVTSHALDQNRVWGIHFQVGVVTNVTREHLDYHKTYENYLKTKGLLIKWADKAVLNADDGSFEYLKTLKEKAVTYSLKNPVVIPFKLNLPGEYNISNALAASAAAVCLGINSAAIRKGLENLTDLPGRFEEINEGQDFKVIVDFAHTPNALENVLTEVVKRKSSTSRIILVFGCAGLRDTTKRPMMGEISGRLADLSILTAEDPRTEDVNRIIGEIAEGSRRAGAMELTNRRVSEANGIKHGFIIETDRKEAIRRAINRARAGDWVLITGKGHEKSMCFGEVEFPWSDQEEVRQALRVRG